MPQLLMRFPKSVDTRLSLGIIKPYQHYSSVSAVKQTSRSKICSVIIIQNKTFKLVILLYKQLQNITALPSEQTRRIWIVIIRRKHNSRHRISEKIMNFRIDTLVVAQSEIYEQLILIVKVLLN